MTSMSSPHGCREGFSTWYMGRKRLENSSSTIADAARFRGIHEKDYRAIDEYIIKIRGKTDVPLVEAAACSSCETFVS